MRCEAKPLGPAAPQARAGRADVSVRFGRIPVWRYQVLAARVWRSYATMSALIVSAPFALSVSAHAQAMSDMPGMEHPHHGGAPVSERQPAVSAPRATRRSHPRARGSTRATAD